MNYKSFNLGDWISHISGVIEDESELDGNEMRDLVEFLSRLPRWIPVSEMLPEKDVEVLVTTEWDCITIGEMFSSNDWFIHEGATNADIDDIKAWMPLPEPYKAESEK